MTKTGLQRAEILEACRAFGEVDRKPFQPGVTSLPAAGKIVDGNDIAAMVDACLDGWLTAGRFAKQFEEGLSAFTGLKHALLTVSGSAANLLAFSALTSPRLPRPIKPGDEVITVAASFPTTVAPILQNRCIPVFLDVELDTANVDITLLEEARSSRTRAVMLAHTLGNPFNLEAISAFCKKT